MSLLRSDFLALTELFQLLSNAKPTKKDNKEQKQEQQNEEKESDKQAGDDDERKRGGKGRGRSERGGEEGLCWPICGILFHHCVVSLKQLSN